MDSGSTVLYFCGGAGNDTATGALTKFDGWKGSDTLYTHRCAKGRQTVKNVGPFSCRTSDRGWADSKATRLPR